RPAHAAAGAVGAAAKARRALTGLAGLDAVALAVVVGAQPRRAVDRRDAALAEAADRERAGDAAATEAGVAVERAVGRRDAAGADHDLESRAAGRAEVVVRGDLDGVRAVG